MGAAVAGAASVAAWCGGGGACCGGGGPGCRVGGRTTGRSNVEIIFFIPTIRKAQTLQRNDNIAKVDHAVENSSPGGCDA